MRDKTKTLIGAVLVIALLLVAGVYTNVIDLTKVQSAIPSASQNGDCYIPSTGKTSVVLDVTNLGNTTGSEGYDVTARFYGADGSITKITDTTSPSASDLNAGTEYTVKIESTNGASGDNSMIKSILNGNGAIVDGNYKFKACGASMNINIGAEQQATIQSKLFNVVANAWMYDSSDADATDYQTDGVTFKSTTDNSTATAIGTSGCIEMKQTVQAVETDTNWIDREGLMIYVDASSSEYDVDNIVMKVNGATVSEASLDTYEARALNDYEKIYLAPITELTNTKEAVLEYKICALAGVDASADIQIDLGAVGQYQKTLSANELAVGAYTDSAVPSTVRTVYDSTIDVS